MSKVDHPEHYNAHPSGVECIDVAECFGFSIGNAIKYLWRAGLKGDAVEDLEKARWYIDREIARLKKPTQLNQAELLITCQFCGFIEPSPQRPIRKFANNRCPRCDREQEK